MKYAFLEGHTLLYPGYRDAETGKSLVAEPGGVYDVLPGMPPDGRWAPAPAEEEPAVVKPKLGTWLGVSRELTEDLPLKKPESGDAGEGEEA